MSVHFEISHDNGTCTEPVFQSDSIVECLNQWRKRGYVEPEYFIEAWEDTGDELPFPVAQIKIEDHCFKTIDAEFWRPE